MSSFRRNAKCANSQAAALPFATTFEFLTGHEPMRWQERLFELMRRGCIPDAIDLPTGLGKTSVMAIWLLARAFPNTSSVSPRRLIYVVDRRVVVDQATAEAERISSALSQNNAVSRELRTRLGLRPGQNLPVSTLRGGRADSREWTYDAAAPAIVVGTIDMIGSRLLFSGYRMSRWSRSMQAGLIGVDSLIVLDEAHLSAAFCEAVPRALQLQVGISGGAFPVARFLPLSATLGKADGGRTFRLEPADEDDAIVRRRTGRLEPTKRLTFDEVPDAKSELAEALAGCAAKCDGQAQAVLVYCTSRKNANATAENLCKALGKGRENDVRLITGVRRGHERDMLVWTDTYLAFTYNKEGSRIAPADGRTRFLVCTAAGEVGADLDADAAIMDLVPLERMIQRLGRVNRRGAGVGPAPVVIYYDPAALKSSLSGKDETKKATAARLLATKAALDSLPRLDRGDHDGSPSHLTAIEPNVRKAASTPPPEVIPTIEREHVEAWAFTSLKVHPGRPNVEPFLRGVVEDKPETTVAWRADVALLAKLPDAAVEQAITAARLHPAEVLEAPASEVADFLIKRIKSLRKAWEKSASDNSESNEKDERDGIKPPLRLLLFKSGQLIGRGEISPEQALIHLTSETRKTVALSEDAKTLGEALANTTLLLQPAIGGLNATGVLADCDEPPGGLQVQPTDNEPDGWRGIVIRLALASETAEGEQSRLLTAPPKLLKVFGEKALREMSRETRRQAGLRRSWWTKLPGTTEDDEGSLLEYWKSWDVDGETGAAARLQSLTEHHSWAKAEMEDLAKRLDLPAPFAGILARAIAVHDLGKDRPGWQDGVGAPRDGRPYAKSDRRGPGIGNYRHEFGSLRDVLYKDAGSLNGVGSDLRDLALHLIAAHHGRARPSIPAEDQEEIFEDVLDQNAFDAAVRYIRLQRRWGPWGLAWLEALFRSVDATVSRRLDREKEPAGLVEIKAAQ
jgi:CRISPR-associated endonuclease/helicase Cas3